MEKIIEEIEARNLKAANDLLRDKGSSEIIEGFKAFINTKFSRDIASSEEAYQALSGLVYIEPIPK